MIVIEGLIVFLIVGGVSYLSNIPPGFVNVKVIETSLFKGYRKSIKVSIGAAIAELVYSSAALFTALYLQKFPVLFYGINVFVTMILIGFAIRYFFGKTYAQQIEDAKIEFKDDKKQSRNHYLFGAGVGLLNPQMFPYWFIFFSSALPIYDIQFLSSYYVGVAGAVGGGFGLLWTYSLLAAKYRRKIFSVFAKYPINMYVGIMFVVMAIIKIYDLVNKLPW